MAICKRDDCDELAVDVQLVRTAEDENEARKLRDWCRVHRVEERRDGGFLVPVEVTTNRAAIMGVDGSENRKGARIELDSEEIRIDQLVDLGFVKVLPVEPAPKTAPKPAAPKG